MPCIHIGWLNCTDFVIHNKIYHSTSCSSAQRPSQIRLLLFLCHDIEAMCSHTSERFLSDIISVEAHNAVRTKHPMYDLYIPIRHLLHPFKQRKRRKIYRGVHPFLVLKVQV